MMNDADDVKANDNNNNNNNDNGNHDDQFCPPERELMPGVYITDFRRPQPNISTSSSNHQKRISSQAQSIPEHPNSNSVSAAAAVSSFSSPSSSSSSSDIHLPSDTSLQSENNKLEANMQELTNEIAELEKLIQDRKSMIASGVNRSSNSRNTLNDILSQHEESQHSVEFLQAKIAESVNDLRKLISTFSYAFLFCFFVFFCINISFLDHGAN
jgi:hypothetical protein